MRTIHGAVPALSLTLPASSEWSRPAAAPMLRLGAVLAVLLAFSAGPVLANPGAMPSGQAETAAVTQSQHWQEAVMWEGRLSTPEADCINDGLVLAPWGIYPASSRGVVVWCVASEIYPDLGSKPWELWTPVAEGTADGYCKVWHGTRLEHEQPDGRFWCEEADRKDDPLENPAPPAGSPDRA